MNNVVDCLRQHAWAKEIIKANGQQVKRFTKITKISHKMLFLP
jgi:hypothetical protein